MKGRITSYLFLTFALMLPLLSEAQHNYALAFDGADDHLVLPDQLVASYNVLTLELWVRTRSYGVIVGQQNSKPFRESSVSKVPVLYIGTDGKLRAVFWYGNVRPIFSLSVINDGSWHHIAFSSTGNIQSLYIDGTLQGSITGPVNNAAATPYNQMGAGLFGGWDGWDGINEWKGIEAAIDEVRLWNVSRSQEEISQWKEVRNVESQSGLVSLWHFDEGTGNIASDAKGDNDAILAADTLHFPNDPQGPQWILFDSSADRADLGISSFEKPVSSCELDSAVILKVWLHNQGNLPVSVFDISYTINGQLKASEHFSGPAIEEGESREYTFQAKADLSSEQSYNIKVFVSLPEDFSRSNDTVQHTVHHYPAPVYKRSKDTTICPGTAAVLNVSGEVYVRWDNGSSNAHIIVAPERDTCYHMVLSNNWGCIRKDSVKVMVFLRTLPVVTAGKLQACLGESILLTTTIPGNNTWSTGIRQDSVRLNQTGTYFVIHRDGNGCKVISAPVTLHFVAEPSIATASRILCEDQEAELKAMNSTICQWYEDDLDHPVGKEVTLRIKPSRERKYIMKANNGEGCSGVDSVIIKVLKRDIPGAIRNMIPAENASGLQMPVNFSWSPGINSSSYDLYIWPEHESRPATPSVADINSINYTFRQYLSYEHSYLWQVVSRNACAETEGPVQKFSVKAPPDLVVESVEAPVNTTIESGSRISIRWTVRNAGIGPSTGAWYDAIYLSANNKLGDGDDVKLGSVLNEVFLNSAVSSYTKTTEVTLPYGKTGEFYVLVSADEPSYQVEANEQNNILASATITLKVTSYADLRVLAPVLVPADTFSNEVITIRYTVKNMGTGPVRENSWRDWIYGAPSDDPNDLEKVFLGHYTHTGTLDSGQTYTGILKARLPRNTFGTYYIHINTDFENLVYEYIFEDNNRRISPPVTIYMSPPPDLVVEALHAPQEITSGQSVKVDIRIRNTGTGPTSASVWTDNIYLVNHPSQPSFKKLLIKSVHYGKLEAEESYSATAVVRMPLLAKGSYYLLAETDGDRQVFEWKDEGNNFRYSDSFTMVSPDLTALIRDVPDTIYSGRELSFSYVLYNWGTGKMEDQSWSDAVYLVTAGGTGTLPLGQMTKKDAIAPGDSLACEARVRIPEGKEGLFTLQIMTDAGNAVAENEGEGNNSSPLSRELFVKLSPWPDLQVSGMTAQDTAEAYRTVETYWTVSNLGKGTARPSWTDQIYISPKSSPQQLTLLNTIVHYDSLAPGAAYSKNYTVRIPHYFSGDALLHLHTDVSGKLYEYTSEGNNIGSIPLYIRAYPPVDLAAQDLVIPALGGSGKKIAVTYLVKNVGEGKTPSDKWYDHLYLSADSLINTGDIPLGEGVLHSGVLDKDASYRNTVQVTLPDGISGKYFILVQSDYLAGITDINRSNNVMASAQRIDISFTPPPDLQVTLFTAPAEGFSGQPISLQWSVENKGTGIAGAPGWRDEVYLSANTVLDAGDLFISGGFHTDSLPAGAAYTSKIDIPIPLSVKGNYYLLIVTDARNKLYEHDNESNNTAYGTITLILPPPADLTVRNIRIPSETTTGDSITIEWETFNKGENPAAGFLEEYIYISADEVWDMNDLLAGALKSQVNLEVQRGLTHTITIPVPGIIPGNYYLVVRTDVSNRIYEDNEDNNTAASLTSIRIDIPLLLIGKPFTFELTGNKDCYFKIEVPDSLVQEVLSVKLLPEIPDEFAGLYLRQNGIPDLVNFDLAAMDASSSNRQIVVPGLEQGVCYLMVKGEFSDTRQVTIHPEILPFGIHAMKVNKGGNTGSVTAEIRGSKFSGITSFRLRKGTEIILSSSSQPVSLTKAFVTFDLRNRKPGIYDVVAVSETGDTTVLTGGFEIVPGNSPGLSLNLQHPSSTRGVQVISVSLNYANMGNTDIASPKVRFTSTSGSPIALDPDKLNSKTPVTVLELPLRELNGPDGMLRAGTGGNIVIYCTSSPAPAFTVTQVQ